MHYARKRCCAHLCALFSVFLVSRQSGRWTLSKPRSSVKNEKKTIIRNENNVGDWLGMLKTDRAGHEEWQKIEFLSVLPSFLRYLPRKWFLIRTEPDKLLFFKLFSIFQIFQSSVKLPSSLYFVIVFERLSWSIEEILGVEKKLVELRRHKEPLWLQNRPPLLIEISITFFATPFHGPNTKVRGRVYLEKWSPVGASPIAQFIGSFKDTERSAKRER